MPYRRRLYVVVICPSQGPDRPDLRRREKTLLLNHAQFRTGPLAEIFTQYVNYDALSYYSTLFLMCTHIYVRISMLKLLCEDMRTYARIIDSMREDASGNIFVPNAQNRNILNVNGFAECTLCFECAANM